MEYKYVLLLSKQVEIWLHVAYSYTLCLLFYVFSDFPWVLLLHYIHFYGAYKNQYFLRIHYCQENNTMWLFLQ